MHRKQGLKLLFNLLLTLIMIIKNVLSLMEPS